VGASLVLEDDADKQLLFNALRFMKATAEQLNYRT